MTRFATWLITVGSVTVLLSAIGVLADANPASAADLTADWHSRSATVADWTL